MNKKNIKKLVQASYNKKNLDIKNINKIASLLKRADLKRYIKALKTNEIKSTVFIEMPKIYKDGYHNFFKKKFPDKKIVYSVNPSLLLGVKIIDLDTVYEMNLSNVLNNLAIQTQQIYD